MAIGIICLISALYFLFSAFVITTENWQLAIYFKFIPFVLGVACLWAGARIFGWI